jgi:glycosyltransferase involved in cell wall biosynthesis
MSRKPFLSVVIPVMNEEDNIKPLIASLETSLAEIDYEVIFIDDGSSDKTVANINAANKDNITVIEFSRNYGQTSAIAAGIHHATGDYIATMDGDLQNDPSDIPMMLERIQKDSADVVVGKRKKRQDGWVLRRIPSKIANWLIRKATKVDISDLGCTLKVFKIDLAKKLDLYGEMHRFIPILASMYGAKIVEVDVKHHARQFGQTKYGIDRTFRVISDLLLMLFLIRYRQKPMHLFGYIALVLLSFSAVITPYLFIEKLMGHDIGQRPLFFIDILFIIMAMQFITTGFVAELLVRAYYTDTRKPYNIFKITGKKFK